MFGSQRGYQLKRRSVLATGAGVVGSILSGCLGQTDSSATVETEPGSSTPPPISAPAETQSTPKQVTAMPFDQTNAPVSLSEATDWKSLESHHKAVVRTLGSASFSYVEMLRPDSGTADTTYTPHLAVEQTTDTDSESMYRKNTYGSGQFKLLELYNHKDTRYARAVFTTNNTTYEEIVRHQADGEDHKLTSDTDKMAWTGSVIFDTIRMPRWELAYQELVQGVSTASYAAVSTSDVVDGQLRIDARGFVRSVDLVRAVDTGAELKRTTFSLETEPQSVPQPDWITRDPGRSPVNS